MATNFQNMLEKKLLNHINGIKYVTNFQQLKSSTFTETLFYMLIIYTKKLLNSVNSDWLKKECKMCNTSAKSVIQCKLHIKILGYDWPGPIKSFAFKSSAHPGWRNFSLIA